jgi:predicted  nucleic acid-binding Zn-ribbon protein
MSEIIENTEVQTSPEVEMIPVQNELDEPFQLFSELNTIYSEKEKYKDEHLAKKTSEVFSKLSEKTGIPFPGMRELETQKAELEGKLSETQKLYEEKNSSVEALQKELADAKSVLEKQNLELEKIREGRAGRVYGESELTRPGSSIVEQYRNISDPAERMRFFVANKDELTKKV